jgi:hypothetical protein
MAKDWGFPQTIKQLMCISLWPSGGEERGGSGISFKDFQKQNNVYSIKDFNNI